MGLVVRSYTKGGSSGALVGALGLLVANVALLLAACGGSDTAPIDLPTRTMPVAAVTFPADQKPQSGGTGGSTGGLALGVATDHARRT